LFVAAWANAMELHQIRYFLALCDELNFTRAAEQCGVAQSSLTRAIKALEQELGGALFNRERANTHLSKLGQKVRPFLQQAYGHVEGAKRQAQDFLRLQTSSLRLGLMSATAPGRFVELVSVMRVRHPGIALQVTDGTAQALQDRLLAGELDAAIYAHPDLATDERLDHLPLYREPFVIVVQNTHRLARQNVVRAQDLRGETALRRPHCEYEAAFTEWAADGPPLFQSDREDWILSMAAAGLGYGLLPAFSVNHAGVTALRLTDPDVTREISLVTVRGRPDSSALGALVHEVMRMRGALAGLALGADARMLAASPAR